MPGYQQQGFQESHIRAPGVSYDEHGNVIITAVFPDPSPPPTEASPLYPKPYAPLRGEASPPPPPPKEPLILYIPLECAPKEIDRALMDRRLRTEQLLMGMEQEARAATDRIASAVASSRQEYRTIPYAVWVVTRKGRNLLREFTRFASTFAVIFSILFVSLNYQSFWQILSPYLRPEEERARSLALQRIVDPSLSQKLQRIPSLTTAGADMAALPLLDLSVLPPDTRLVIPKIGKNVPITHPSSNALEREDWKAFDEEIQRELKNGVVHYPGTARPGQRGNAFFTGHSSYYPWDSGRYKDVFARLPELVVGDVYVIYDHGRAHHYRVTNVFEVMPDDASVLDQPFNRQMSTLMTCVPIGTTLRRLIVQGEEFDPLTGELILSDIYAVDERLPTPEVLLPI